MKAEVGGTTGCRIGIVVVAYNAASTLESVLDRIPVTFRPQIAEVLVCDDHSQDSTYDVAKTYQGKTRDLTITIVRNSRNLGYGGNQKAAYRLAREHGIDIVVLLHGDGQYAPEVIPELIAPIERGDCDAVMGSRMMIPGAAHAGGMPMYKYVGNRILTRFQNRMLESELSEFHSGYRAYRMSAISDIPLERNDDGFSFDTQIIVQLFHYGKRISEIPIPTYYGDEICYVNGMKYAAEVSLEVLRYRLWMMGFGLRPRCMEEAKEQINIYDLKPSESSSHGTILAQLRNIPPQRVLDLGCSSGQLSEQIRKMGHHVVGIDIMELEGIHDHVDDFLLADLDQGLPQEVRDEFDVIVAGDVIEHLRSPLRLFQDAPSRLSKSGVLIACVPNFGHWYPRARTALGRFDYDRRGILDEGHVRFFTRRSFERLVTKAGWSIEDFTPTGLPFDILSRGIGRRALRAAAWVERMATRAWPELFAYQLVYRLAPLVDEAMQTAPQ